MPRLSTALLVILLPLITFATITRVQDIHHINETRCRDLQSSWDNRRAGWMVLTEPTHFPPSLNAELLTVEAAANNRRAKDRSILLAGLGPRPNC